MQSFPLHTKILLAGSGPASLLLAVACAAESLEVTLIAPNFAETWHNQYGVWEAAFAGLGWGEAIAQRWTRQAVWLDSDDALVFKGTSYANICNKTFQEILRARLTASNVTLVEDRVETVNHERDHSLVRTCGGQTWRARIFVDATGHTGHFTRRVSSVGARAFQTAYGVLAELEGDPLDAETMIWMDFRAPSPDVAPLPGGMPSFLYGMPLGPGRAFLEETVLVGKPEVPVSVLKARLFARLKHRGIKVRSIQKVEQCRIPMDSPMPHIPQRTLAFGGAASMVHPATGYMVGRCAELAPRVAQALAAGLRRGETGDRLTALAWEAVWPAELSRTQALYSFGGRMLAGFDQAQTVAFFRAFFGQREETWRAYLSWSLSPWQIGQMMWGVYGLCDAETRSLLRRAALEDPKPVLKGLLGSGWRGRGGKRGGET